MKPPKGVPVTIGECELWLSTYGHLLGEYPRLLFSWSVSELKRFGGTKRDRDRRRRNEEQLERWRAARA